MSIQPLCLTLCGGFLFSNGCFPTGLIVYSALNSVQPEYLKQVLIPQAIVIQPGHLITRVWWYIKLELFLVNEFFRLLELDIWNSLPLSFFSWVCLFCSVVFVLNWRFTFCRLVTRHRRFTVLLADLLDSNQIRAWFDGPPLDALSIRDRRSRI